MLKVAVIGAGSWGTALANIAAENANCTYLWVRRRKLADEIIKTHENRLYLPGAKISTEINISTNLEQVVSKADIVIMAVPSHAVRVMAKQLRYYLKNDVVVVSASKGIELDSFKRMSQVLAEELYNGDNKNLVALSGPSHAEEVIRNLPTAIVAASSNQHAAEMLQDALMNTNFRIYTNTDIIGVELGGALKNVIAICSGISDGLGFGDNSRAALMTRGITEIIRLGIALGAKPETFSGLSGIGDLIVTCSSQFSRNRKAGMKIGQGKTVKEITESTNMVIEGFNTTKATFLLAKKYGIEMPITEQAYLVLFEGKNPAAAVNSLMNRVGKHEHEDTISQNFFIR
ncbi:NAD(P)H-dependent glycerol-3-phosphate dehydrogenase [Tepidanaerobacter acetatoxydans Re1]|uniref:Glycerol-3-phosphate dehydrogenase [NAD(P)+] n=1 Tax=Tepidanaerobacter acetatoxydans (strain DSM 21804 / JCM 16047 / Re1) TaxID=1209989 RepID=F4LT37_TEPAE|nr:NAD(P)H-dependent glycerol-3-phosphate dehydrogenase [Tepidanaerobacter acetatoxydans]AEE91306.1 Glycerol-3-phosphate dehydrogenase (NAD(P)+) [Tepidanaerobacter acetatoxydans Re1]CCP25994.1 NAD(P)H-dependent glycerol-3-phosphate dehydrogenase [Tepidanaerobacter acetatoxydans Re1]